MGEAMKEVDRPRRRRGGQRGGGAPAKERWKGGMEEKEEARRVFTLLACDTHSVEHAC